MIWNGMASGYMEGTHSSIGITNINHVQQRKLFSIDLCYELY